MFRALRMSGALCCALALLSRSSAPAQSSDSAAVIRGVDFARAATQLLADHYNRQIADLEGQQRALPPGSPQREALQRQIDDLRTQAHRAAGGEPAWRAYDAIKTILDTCQEAEAAVADTQTLQAGATADLDALLGGQLAPLKPEFDRACLMVTVAERVQAFADLKRCFRDLHRRLPAPHVANLVAGLNTLHWLLDTVKAFSPANPLLNQVLGAYSEVTAALSGAAGRLAQGLSERDTENFVPGYSSRWGDRRAEAFFDDPQFERFTGQDNVEVNRVPGLRDAYELPDGSVALWDPEASSWSWARNLTPGDVAHRYAWLMIHGIADPDPEDVLSVNDRVIGVQLIPERAVVSAGEATGILVSASVLEGDLPVGLTFDLATRQKTLGGWFEGRDSLMGAFADPRRSTPSPLTVQAAPGETVMWQAPAQPDVICQIRATLTDSADGVLLAEPAYIATGKATEISARPDRNPVEPGYDGLIVFQVLDGAGQPLSGVPRGVMVTNPDELAIEEIEWLDADLVKGAVPYQAPQEAGTYRLGLRFGGTVDEGYILHDNWSPSEVEVQIVVTGQPVVAEGAEPPLPPPGPNVQAHDGTYQGGLNEAFLTGFGQRLSQRTDVRQWSVAFPDIVLLVQGDGAQVEPAEVAGRETIVYADGRERITEKRFRLSPGDLAPDGRIAGDCSATIDGRDAGLRWRWFAEPTRDGQSYLLDIRVAEGTNYMSAQLAPMFRLERGVASSRSGGQ